MAPSTRTATFGPIYSTLSKGDIGGPDHPSNPVLTALNREQSGAAARPLLLSTALTIAAPQFRERTLFFPPLVTAILPAHLISGARDKWSHIARFFCPVTLIICGVISAAYIA